MCQQYKMIHEALYEPNGDSKLQKTQSDINNISKVVDNIVKTLNDGLVTQVTELSVKVDNLEKRVSHAPEGTHGK